MVEVYRKDLAGSYTVDNSIDPETGQVRDLAWYRARGYDTDSSVQGTALAGTTSSEPANDGRTYSAGASLASTLYNFLPDAVIDEFAKQWVKSGDADIAIKATRQTKPWKDNFGKLMREDGTLIMDELSFMSVKASYKQHLLK